MTLPRVLVVAGSDSSGGAGIQGDVKTITCMGGYAATAVTALTAQDTLCVHEVLCMDPDFVASQMRAVLADIGADAVKTGMLGSVPVVERVARICEALPSAVPLIVDPVLSATAGPSLSGQERGAFLAALLGSLLPISALVTPNVPEATALTGVTIESRDDMRVAADALLSVGPQAVLLKGGHLPTDAGPAEEVSDLLVTRDGHVEWFASPRIRSTSTHGTGCALASAVATGLAEGRTLRDAVVAGREFVLGALLNAPGFGTGLGPLNHGFGLGSSQSPKTVLA